MNEHEADDQNRPDLAMDRLGRFVVTWRSQGQDGSSFAVIGKRFTSDAVEQPPPCGVQGSGVGTEFQVNAHVPNAQVDPSVAMDGTGHFAVTWTSDGQDGDSSGIFLRRFDRDGEPR